MAAHLNQLARELSDLSNNMLVTNAISDSQGRSSYLAPFLNDINKGAYGFHELRLMDLTGVTLAGTGSVSRAPLWLTPEVVKRLEGGHKHASLERETQRVVIAVPVLFPPSRTVEGVLYGTIALQPLLVSSSQARASDVAVSILDREGRTVTKVEFYPTAQNGHNLQRVLDMISPLDTLGLQAELTVDGFDGVWLTGTLVLVFICGGLIFFFLTVFVSMRVARSISQPVLQLSAAAAQIASSGAAVPDSIPLVGYGEVADLARSLRLMADAVQRNQSILEDRVQSRTRDLQEAKSRLDDVMSSVDDAIWSYVARERQFRVVSEAAERITGIRVRDIISDPIRLLNLIEFADRRKVRAALRQIVRRRSESLEIDLRITTASGIAKVVRTRLRGVFSASGRLLRVDGISTDITVRVSTEIRLRLLERGVNASENGIVITDYRMPDNPVIYVNPAFERITGYGALEAIGRNCRFLLGNDLQQPGVIELRAAINAGHPARVTVRNIRKDGAVFWNDLAISPVLSTSGKVTHYVGVITDVTAKRESESAQQIYMARLESILSLSPDGFATFDIEDRLTFANQAIQRFTDISVEDLHGLKMRQVWGILQRRSDGRYPFPEIEHCFEHEDDPGGRAYDVRKAVMHISGPESPRVVQAAIRDGVTGLAASVMFLRDMTRESEVNRMKSEFLSTAAHELRTPMASILGFSELLLTRELAPDIRKDLYQTVYDQATRLSNLLNELLDLARIEARMGRDFKYTVSPIGSIVRSTLGALMIPGDSRIVKVNVDSEEALVRVDGEKIQQALTNVISNAYKYSAGRGDIELSVTCTAQDVAVTVRDSGIGMTPEQLSHMFERFYRADTTGNIPGTGLGLSLVKEIMEIHGGECRIASEHQVGTTVTLLLPIFREAAVSPAEVAVVA